MNKLRSDSAFCQLTPEQVDVLEGWLCEERLGYPKVLEKLKAEFGLETSLTGVRRFYKRLEMERSRVSLMDAVEMSGLTIEALRSGTLKPGVLALANKCAIELMMESPAPIGKVTALLRAITSAEAHGMKQTVFEREEQERREKERLIKVREGWHMTAADLEEERRDQEEAEREEAMEKLPSSRGHYGGQAIETSNPKVQAEEQELTKAPMINDQGPKENRATGPTLQDQNALTKDAGGALRPGVVEERERVENCMAEAAENRLTPLNAA